MGDCLNKNEEVRDYVLTGVIAEDQRAYIEEVRTWLRAGIPSGRMIDGPISKPDDLN